ncbi:hypothetical protein H5410_057387, partial [Solanum commersonii]
MNAHNKIQFTYARINCVLKDSNCDTPSPKILMLAIVATCANQESDTTLTLKKRNTMHVFTHRFALIFQLTFDPSYSRSKGLSKSCNGLSAK